MGSALAGRNELYERFYLASGARNYQQLAHTLAPKERGKRLVDQLLGNHVPNCPLPKSESKQTDVPTFPERRKWVPEVKSKGD